MEMEFTLNLYTNSIIVGKTTFAFPFNYPIDREFIVATLSSLQKEAVALREERNELESFLSVHRHLSFKEEKSLSRFAHRRGPSWQLQMYLLERDGSACRYCGSKSKKIQYDHVIPASRGGLTTPGNMVCACRDCNRFKWNRTPDECGMAVLPLELTAI